MDANSLIHPLDDANLKLLSHVRPKNWRNPTGDEVYDLLVIGAGTAGLVTASGAARLGAKVALVERALLGGDCLNVGCVPSKSLLRAARIVDEIRKGEVLGISVGAVEVDFKEVMRRMRRRRADIGTHDSAQRFASLGVDVFFGDAQFTGPAEVAVNGQGLRFKRAVIATGTRPAVPSIPGLADIPYLTNETLFWLTERPRRLVIIGGGPVGCEMAQAFARFGSEVTLLDLSTQLLPREDRDAAEVVANQLRRDGVRTELGLRLQLVKPSNDGFQVQFERDGVQSEVIGDQLLVATGRTPNVENLNLEAAGVAYSQQGVVVDDRLRTSAARVFAAGDVCSSFRFTHAADAMARIVIQNALFFGRKSASALVIPWCTYTDPEIAHVGMYEQEAREQRRQVSTLTVPLSDVDRAVIDEEASGFVRVHHDRGKLLGCTIVARHAGEMIGQAAYVITHGGSLADLSATIHPYPTQGEALKKIGDIYRLKLLTPRLRNWLKRYFAWCRSG